MIHKVPFLAKNFNYRFNVMLQMAEEERNSPFLLSVIGFWLRGKRDGGGKNLLHHRRSNDGIGQEADSIFGGWRIIF